MEVLVHFDDVDLDYFIQSDNSENSRIAFTPGTGLKADRFVITDDDLINAGFPVGASNITIRAGSIDDLDSLGNLRAVRTFNWNGTKEANSGSGGGTLSARIGVVSLTAADFLEVVQGEEKVITFIVEAHGRFVQESFDLISVKLADTNGTVISINEDDDYSSIERVCEALDVQVFRCTLSENDTASLVAGLLQIEIAFDSQKARLTHSLKILDQIEE